MASFAISEARSRLADAARAFVEAEPDLGAVDEHDGGARGQAVSYETLTTLIQASDSLIGSLQRSPARGEDELTELLAVTRALRFAVFLAIRDHRPDQAWFWTPEWQAGEREADEDKVSGRSTVHDSDTAFEAALRLRRPDVADP